MSRGHREGMLAAEVAAARTVTPPPRTRHKSTLAAPGAPASAASGDSWVDLVFEEDVDKSPEFVDGVLVPKPEYAELCQSAALRGIIVDCTVSDEDEGSGDEGGDLPECVDVDSDVEGDGSDGDGSDGDDEGYSDRVR